MKKLLYLISNLLPCKIISDNGQPYLERYYVFTLLGVQRNATPEQIKAAYRKKSSECHPDKPGGSDAAMAEVNLAYQEATNG